MVVGLVFGGGVVLLMSAQQTCGIGFLQIWNLLESMLKVKRKLPMAIGNHVITKHLKSTV